MPDLHLAVFGRGLALGGSLIVAIGAQNAYILRQGLKREFVFTLVTICSLSDALLVAVGAGGVGTLVQTAPFLIHGASWLGAAFLFFYGIKAFYAALRPGVLQALGDGSRSTSRWKAVGVCLAVTYLNPHVFLDTVVLVGGLAGRYAGLARVSFAVGAAAASFVWFFGLGYGAAWLAPLFRRPSVWRVLDLIVGCTMWWIAISLLWEEIGFNR